ncbi:MAG: hypothetical protein M0Z66_02245 [Thermaerobacter sp.]|nr:hypothetical protein [Thermaerobacter sp.]
MVDRWLANDWVLRVLSLLLAIGIWITQNPTVVRTVSGLPVMVTNTSKLRVQISPAAVSVQIRGPAQIVDAIQPGAIRVSASVPYAVPGLYRATIHVSTQVAGTEVVAVVPDQVKVTLSTPASAP